MLPVPTMGGDGGGQGLERRHAAGLLAAVEGQVAEHLAHTLAEEADLHKLGADGVPQTHADEQDHQNVIGQILVDLADHGIEHCSLRMRTWTFAISPFAPLARNTDFPPEAKHGPGSFRSTVH